MNALTDALQTIFFALGSAWFAVDLLRKLRAPAAETSPSSPARTEVATEREPSREVSRPPAPELAPSVAAIPAPTPVASAPGPTGVPPAHLAVIAAAIHHVFQGRGRLASVLPAAIAAGAGGAEMAAPIDWAREGRREIFVSHRVR